MELAKSDWRLDLFIYTDGIARIQSMQRNQVTEWRHGVTADEANTDAEASPTNTEEML